MKLPELTPESPKVFVLGLEGFVLLYDAIHDRIVSEIDVTSVDSPEDRIPVEGWSDGED